MPQSDRAKRNLTNQLKKQLEFYRDDLKHERAALEKAKSLLKYNLPGTKSMIAQHQRGVKKTLTDIENMKIRIRKRYKNGKIYKVI